MEEQMMNQMMDMYSEIFKYYPILTIIGIMATAFCVLFMHFSAQHRNHKLGVGWYICGVLFGPWTVLVFLLKRRDFPGPDLKVCPSCGNRCPVNFEVCNRCLVELPEVDTAEKAKQKKLSKIFGIGIIITEVVSLVAGAVLGATMAKSIFEMVGDIDSYYNDEYRIAVDGVFYDKKGNSYEKGSDVVLYDKEGRAYTYTTETENQDIYYYDEEYYVRDDGEKYFVYDCYVTSEGWFYCDKASTLEYYYPDTEKMSQEELDAYYQLQVNQEGDGYRYYYEYLVDEDGNIYYDAFEASWNEKGELITAENDPTVNVEKVPVADVTE